MEALSREWDGASKPQRLRILEHLADPSPREHFADASAQLFFLRIVTAMKIAYVVGSPISAHLTAIATFFDASLGARFQTQFVQVRVARAKAVAARARVHRLGDGHTGAGGRHADDSAPHFDKQQRARVGPRASAAPARRAVRKDREREHLRAQRHQLRR